MYMYMYIGDGQIESNYLFIFKKNENVNFKLGLNVYLKWLLKVNVKNNFRLIRHCSISHYFVNYYTKIR